ncbi:hypothetical protein VN0234_00680 [Helicobacter pylori]
MGWFGVLWFSVLLSFSVLGADAGMIGLSVAGVVGVRASFLGVGSLSLVSCLTSFKVGLVGLDKSLNRLILG